MDQVEVEGNSIDEAIDRALQQLGVERERVEVEILADASRGLFGLGGRKAKIRATVRTKLSADPEPPAPRHAATRQGGKDPAPRTTVAPAPKPRTAHPASSPKRRSVGAGDDAGLEQARAALVEIVRRMGIEATVEAQQDDEGPRLCLTGDSSGILIGRRGQTLDAIEYLINRIASRGDEHGGRIVVDSENYRVRRRQSLEDLAQRMAEQARRRGKAVTLNPMSPRDRRIVHLALQNDPSLVTRSSGSGFFRKLVIMPADTGRPRTKERSSAAAEPSE